MIRFGVLVLAVTCASGKPVQLRSADTVITVEAGPSAPRLTRLEVTGGASWMNQASETLVQGFEWELQAERSDRNSVQFVYECASPHLRLYWEWRLRAQSGPVEHGIRIENLSGHEVWLPLQDSVGFVFRISPRQALKRFWVEKGASSPSAEGTHFSAFTEGDHWTGTSSTYAHPSKGSPREMIPFLLVEDGNESGWYMGIEFSGRTRMELRRAGESVAGRAGLNPEPGPYRTRLAAGATFETPTVFVGAFQGGPDAAANILRRWVREVLNNPVTVRNPSYPMLVSNSWGSGMAINEEQAQRMIADAAALGLEMFHLDAGWFRSIGDWTSNPEKFPRGVGSVADYAHQAGLRFGLWMDWTQAGTNEVRDPRVREWLTTDPPEGWKPEEFKGITVDIGVPAARGWAASRVTKVVRDFHLDMLEHDGYLVAQGCDKRDHPHAPAEKIRSYKEEGYEWVQASNDTDVSYHATRAYYHVQAALRREFPGLMLEICNDGGRMVDFGTAAHGDYFSITDAYDPLSNRRAFFDASYVLPPAMLEMYVEKWPAPRIENFRYMLRSGLMGWFSLMQDSNAWTPEQHAAARAEFALYKEKLRPLIREADVYHVSERPDGVHWDGMEFFDPARGAGVLFAFRGSGEEHSHTFGLRGLQENRTYRITFHDHSANDYSEKGKRLMRTGVTVHEPFTNSSEIVFLEEVK